MLLFILPQWPADYTMYLTYVSASIPQLSLMCNSAEEALQSASLSPLSPAVHKPLSSPRGTQREEHSEQRVLSLKHTKSTKKHTKDKQSKQSSNMYTSSMLFNGFYQIWHGKKAANYIHLTQNEILAMYWCFYKAINSDLSRYLLKDLQ